MGLFQRTMRRNKKRKPARRHLRLERLESRNLLALDLAAISGTAFVDLTGDGLTGDDTRVNGATVELYRDNGDGLFDAATDALLGSTTTDGAGRYRFASTNAGGSLPANTLAVDDYFMRQLPTASFTPPAASLVSITSAHVNGTTVQTVDTFDTTEQVVTADPVTTTASSSVAAAEVIGGERDVLVNYLSGAGEVAVQIDRFNSNVFAFVSGLNVVGNAVVQYDGADGDATTLDATGLGTTDFSNSDANAGILLATQGDSTGATAVVRIYSNATDFSTATITIPDQVSTEEIFVPFSAFTTGGGAGATFTSIGAVELLINGVANLDGTITVLRSLRPNDATSNIENSVSSIEIVKSTNGEDANTATGPYLAVGTTATFSYVVRSTGGTPLQNVVVTDDDGTPADTSDDFVPTLISGDTNSNNVLETTETWIYQAARTVTAGQYSNIASVTAEDNVATQVADSDPSNHFGVDAVIDVVKSTNGQDANILPGPVLPVGSTATFTYIVTNTGNVSLGSVVMRDDNGTPGDTSDDFDAVFTGGDTNSNGQLETTETWTYQATQPVTAGQYTNIGSVTGTPLDATGVAVAGIPAASDSDPSNYFGAVAGVTITKSTNGEDANTAPGPALGVGSIATFEYVVTNTGNVPLDSVVVRDDNGTPGDTSDDFNAALQSGDVNSNGRLDTTETWNYQATRTVTAGQYTNVGTATGNPVDASGEDISGLDDASATDPSNHLGVIASINVVKSTNGQDANSTTGPLLLVGSTATFTYVVTNTGTTPLALVVVNDDNGTSGDTSDDFTPTLQNGDTNSDGRLDTTETWTYQATRTVTLGQYTNNSDVTANPVDATGADIPSLADVADTDPSNHLGIQTGIHLVKSTNGQDANATTGPIIAVGDTVTFTFVVTNTGTVALGAVTVVDDNGTAGDTSDDFSPTLQSGDTNSNGRLDTTETWTYLATRTVTAGQYTNTGTVNGNPVDATGADIIGVADVSDTDPSNHFGFTSGINLQKLTNGIDTGTGAGPNLSVGSTVLFTYNVTNTGNFALTNVAVTDDNGTPNNTADDLIPSLLSGDTDGDNELDVTETWVFQVSGIVTPGAYSNTAVVTGQTPDTDLVTATDLSAYFGFNRLSKRRFIASRN